MLQDNVPEIRRSGRGRVRTPHQIVTERIVLEITLKMLTVQVFHFFYFRFFVVAYKIFTWNSPMIRLNEGRHQPILGFYVTL